MTASLHSIEQSEPATASTQPEMGDPQSSTSRRDVDRAPAGRPLEFDPVQNRLNHNVFRYPAKFHPPIARRLIELFSTPGDKILDPFCGSGTLLVEASTLGRHSIGSDVDPLAVFVAHAKTHLHDLRIIKRTRDAFALWLDELRALDLEVSGGFDQDIDQATFDERAVGLLGYIPLLPRIDHWFRRRVVLQLASMRKQIDENYHGQGALFLNLCFASIIRNSSNADPVPVSGLEVTSHMLAKEAAGRAIDPWRLFHRSMIKTEEAVAAYSAAKTPESTIRVVEADARTLDENIKRVDAAITSPPYLTAVDYYRRHTLEMYWLGLTQRREDRLEVMTRYIGRDRIPAKQLPTQLDPVAARVADSWIKRFPNIKPEGERTFRHYCNGMALVLQRLSELVVPGGPIVIVAGDVRFTGKPVSMLELMRDLAGPGLYMADHLWYPIVNRYMSYARNNEANIAADHVLVFRRR